MTSPSLDLCAKKHMNITSYIFVSVTDVVFHGHPKGYTKQLMLARLGEKKPRRADGKSFANHESKILLLYKALRL